MKRFLSAVLSVVMLLTISLTFSAFAKNVEETEAVISKSLSLEEPQITNIQFLGDHANKTDSPDISRVIAAPWGTKTHVTTEEYNSYCTEFGEDVRAGTKREGTDGYPSYPTFKTSQEGDGWDIDSPARFTASNTSAAVFEKYSYLINHDKYQLNSYGYYYGGVGKYDGTNDSYYITFDINAPGTMFIIDREGKGCPNAVKNGYERTSTYTLAGFNTNVYAKHYNADTTVKIPSYGWDNSWGDMNGRSFMDPSIFVFVFDAPDDTSVKSFSYIVNGEKKTISASEGQYEYNVALYQPITGTTQISAVTNVPDATYTVLSDSITDGVGQAVVRITAADRKTTQDYTLNFDYVPIEKTEFSDPSFEREEWLSLNGEWYFSRDAGVYDSSINVPYSWESPLSGNTNRGQGIGYYRRPIEWNPKNENIFLVFGAVDYSCEVFVNEISVGTHVGGYSRFEFDVTDLWKRTGENIIDVVVTDNSTGSQVAGKQAYGQLRGIWQNVWLEARPENYITSFFCKTQIDGTVTYDVEVNGADGGVVSFSGREETATVQDGHATLKFQVEDPILWDQENPHLYYGDLTLTYDNAVDRVSTYFGIREIGTAQYSNGKYYITLNGKPIFLNGVLDQGFNADGFFTAPTDKFCEEEIKKLKDLGINMIRYHGYVPEPLRLYYADKMGMLVMEDIGFVRYRPNEAGMAQFEREMEDQIIRDRNHPSVFYWVVFNESWGMVETDGTIPASSYEWAVKCYNKVKQMDPTRLVEDNSPNGGNHTITDVNTWHMYVNGYSNTKNNIETFCNNAYPGSNSNYYNGYTMGNVPVMNSECGNVWGVSGGSGESDISWQYRYMINEFRRQETLCGFVFTEFRDVPNEFNGFYKLNGELKDTGYSLYGTSINDLHTADYVGADYAPMTTVRAGETISVPMFFSSFTDARHDKNLTLKFELITFDVVNGENRSVLDSRNVTVNKYGTTVLEDFTFTVPQLDGVAELLWTLYDGDERVTGNFILFDVNSPRNDALSIEPSAATSSGFDTVIKAIADSKISGIGKGSFNINVSTDDIPNLTDASNIRLMFEASTREPMAHDFADGALPPMDEIDYVLNGYAVDPGTNPNSFRQTDSKLYPGRISVYLDGEKVGTTTLADCPADSRGALSHHYQSSSYVLNEAGSYGYLIDMSIPASMIAGKENFNLTFTADDDSGLSLYGRRSGRYGVGILLMADGHSEYDENNTFAATNFSEVKDITANTSFPLTGELAGKNFEVRPFNSTGIRTEIKDGKTVLKFNRSAGGNGTTPDIVFPTDQLFIENLMSAVNGTGGDKTVTYQISLCKEQGAVPAAMQGQIRGDGPNDLATIFKTDENGNIYIGNGTDSVAIIGDTMKNFVFRVNIETGAIEALVDGVSAGTGRIALPSGKDAKTFFGGTIRYLFMIRTYGMPWTQQGAVYIGDIEILYALHDFPSIPENNTFAATNFNEVKDITANTSFPLTGELAGKNFEVRPFNSTGIRTEIKDGKTVLKFNRSAGGNGTTPDIVFPTDQLFIENLMSAVNGTGGDKTVTYQISLCKEQGAVPAAMQGQIRGDGPNDLATIFKTDENGNIYIGNGTDSVAIIGDTMKNFVFRVNIETGAIEALVDGVSAGTGRIALPSGKDAKTFFGGTIRYLFMIRTYGMPWTQQGAVYIGDIEISYVYCDLNAIELKTPATCVSPAIYYKLCRICGTRGNEFEIGEIDSHNHASNEYTETETAEGIVVTHNCCGAAYGLIPEAYKNADDYPFVIFADGVFEVACRYWSADGNSDNVLSYLSNNLSAASNVTVLMRKDYTMASSVDANYYDLQYMRTKHVTIDLAGYTFNDNNVTHMFMPQIKGATAANPDIISIEVKNGTIVNNKSVIYVTCGTETAYKGFNFTFDGIDFESNGGKVLDTDNHINLQGLQTICSGTMDYYPIDVNFKNCKEAGYTSGLWDISQTEGTKVQVTMNCEHNYNSNGICSFCGNDCVLLTSDIYTVEENTINGYHNMTVQDIMSGAKIAGCASIQVYNADGTMAAVDDAAKKDMYAVVTALNGLYSRIYTLNVESSEFLGVDYNVDGSKIEGTFSEGTLMASLEAKCYIPTSVALIIAQYDTENRLIGYKVEERVLTGKDKIECEYVVETAENTTIKIMVFESLESIRPLMNCVSLNPGNF